MRFFTYIFTLVCVTCFAQDQELIQSIYFDFDKYEIRSDQQTELHKFMASIDTTQIESIQIFGYCDDRGKDAYNYDLSTHRANTIKDTLLLHGIKNKIIILIEGKGRILIDEDFEINVPKARSKNRRVDVLVNFIPLKTIRTVNETYAVLRKDVIVGDKITLDKVLFEKGSSKLSRTSKTELDKIAIRLHRYPNIQIEVQGHVCCTPVYQKEAIDRATQKRELSINRSKTVYKYLISRRVNEKRLTYKGYGNTQPLGKSPELDRRVELIITKN
ncbi:OmpA family protein [uncultured Flavobacterium sp.]|uniref:OmpA family protein n=1 Tax=uncultured Flavobacterium sp. TaxID=165435 RepID=UPI0030CA4321|tara:strand:+ start:8954 stop:9772 length:819 start_codon:yes stop_codon:yes gene_type:complete